MNEWEWGLLEERQTAGSVSVGGVELTRGSLVRLKPRSGGDIFDLALAGRAAVIESIEQDYEGKLHLAVVLEDDPGKDLGMLRQPGHRFFFTPEEVEPLRQPRILIAGIGNIFLGDDAFGTEVVRRLPAFPPHVTVRDFGIRGYDLAYALLDGYDVTILIDAAPRGEPAGTLYVIEPEFDPAPDLPQPDSLLVPAIDAHALNPVSVLHMARSLGPIPGRILLVACEPEDLGGEEGRMGLTAAVSASVEGAVDLIESLVAKLLHGGPAEDVFPISSKREDVSHGNDAHG